MLYSGGGLVEAIIARARLREAGSADAVPHDSRRTATDRATRKQSRFILGPLLRSGSIVRDYAAASATTVKKWFWGVSTQVQSRERLSCFDKIILG